VQIGGVGFIFATGRNVTGLRQAEKDLRESEAQYHLLAEHVTDFIWLMDMNLKPTYQSPSGEKFTGFTSEEIMELPLEKRLTPESLKLAAEVFLKDIPRVQAEPDYNPILTIELEVYRKDGTTMWSENKLSVIRDESGKPVSILGEGRDITERKEAERTIEKQREEYRTIFDAVRPMIAYLDKKGVIQRINKAGAITFGREPKEIVGKNMHDFFPTAEADRFAADDNKVMTSGKPLIGLIAEYTLPSGQKRWAQIDRIPYFDEHEDVIGVITLSQDITRRKLSEENLKKSLALVQKTMADTVIAIAKMVEMKDPFTAGHQIRVAQLAAAVAKKMNLTDEQATYLNTAATIHDIGKIYVPSDILSKPGKLGAIEFQIIQAHVQGSYDILKEIDFTGPIAQIVYQHHERMDGSGYPRGLKGPNILPEAKILIVADVVEAMSSHRPYRAAMGIEKALGEITRNRGIKYDEASVDACLEIFYNNEFEFKPV
jgi:PAS domain S-box-containing protein/putative nucleotidyltransferase with HDIG domain